MKRYKELTNLGETIKIGDQYIKREDLINSERPHWRDETSSIGMVIGKFLDYAFRRPEPEPIEVTLNKYYKAKVYSDRVIVNDCDNANFGFEAVEYLYTMVRQAKGENITPPTTQGKEQQQ